MSKRDRDTLSDAIGRMIDMHGTSITIAPDSIATGAMAVIRFDYAIHNAGWHGCYQHMLQLARERLRGRFDPEARAQAFLSGQLEMFGDALQDRYPRRPQRKSDGSWREPEYVLREYLEEDDAWFNDDRLSQISSAANRHRMALEAETTERFGPRKGRAA
jgi:hypothetical protein